MKRSCDEEVAASSDGAAETKQAKIGADEGEREKLLAVLNKLQVLSENDKRVAKVAEVGSKAIAASLSSETSADFFAFLQKLAEQRPTLPADADIARSYHSVFEAAAENLPAFEPTQRYRVETYVLRYVTARVLNTSDAFRFSKAAKRISDSFAKLKWAFAKGNTKPDGEKVEDAINKPELSEADKLDRLSALMGLLKHYLKLRFSKPFTAPDVDNAFRLAADSRSLFPPHIRDLFDDMNTELKGNKSASSLGRKMKKSANTKTQYPSYAS